MADVLLASDAESLIDEVSAAITDRDTTLRVVRAGIDVQPAVEAQLPDLVVLDLQIGNMGGMAVCINLRLEESADRIEHVPVLMLLDRRADVFLARRSQAEGWLVKPLDSIRLRRAARALLEGETWHDPTAAPSPTAAGTDRPVG